MNILHSALDTLRDRYAFISHTSTFRNTGQITPEEFLLAGDYLVYKFPTWSWADASTPAKRVNYLPAGKQFLITRGVPCHRRLDDNFAGSGGAADDLVRDGFLGGPEGEEGGEDDGWLRTGGSSEKEQEKMRGQVQTMSESGNLGDAKATEDDEDEIPDMEDEDDDNEAIIRDPKAGSGTTEYALPPFAHNYLFYPTNLWQSLPKLHLVYNIHPLLQNATALSFWLSFSLGATSATSHVRRHSGRLQGQDSDSGGLSILRQLREDGFRPPLQTCLRHESPARPR